jgi:hypothetical protein
VQFCRLPQGRGDVIHWFIQSQVRICGTGERRQVRGADSRRSTLINPDPLQRASGVTERQRGEAQGDRQGRFGKQHLPIPHECGNTAWCLEQNLLLIRT